jgi:poly(3-hydroxybutyrate) depolymerase
MRSYFVIAYAISLLSLFSCSSHSDKNTTVASTDLENNTAASIKEENIAKGQVIDKVSCKADSAQNYALYLPAAYSPAKTYPVMFIFDPHGDGKLPVTTYKELAEKYNFILAGSNNSKNGTAWQDAQKIANVFFNDVRTRYAVNTQRIYCLGFSGGARIANALTMNDGSITGVICAGAAAPAAQTNGGRENYYFIAIAGNADFNYVEMKKYDMVDLAGHNVKHRLIEFDGKHEWPPVETMDEAFLNA